MDQQENIKSTEKAPEEQSDHGTIIFTLPGHKKSKPARTCQICGGPNNHGCGCEARIRKQEEKARLNALPNIHYEVNSRPFCTTSKPGEKTTKIVFEITCQACRDLLKPKINHKAPDLVSAGFDQAVYNQTVLETLTDRLNNLSDIGLDLFKIETAFQRTLDIIAGDLITIRKILQDEYKEAENTNQQEPE